MFWKKKGEKKLSPKEIIANQIDQLAETKSLSYKLPEVYWTGLGGFVYIETNPKFGEKKERKYLSFTDTVVDGKPAGKRRQLWAFDSSREMAAWLIERGAELLG